MSDFDRDKYGDYEEAIRMLRAESAADTAVKADGEARAERSPDLDALLAKADKLVSEPAPQETPAAEESAPAPVPAEEPAPVAVFAEPAPAEEPAVSAFAGPASAEVPAPALPKPEEAHAAEEDEREPIEPADSAPLPVVPSKTGRKSKKEKDRVTGVFEWVESAIFAVVVVILLFTFVFRIVGIDGRSMVPTLQNDDRVVISNLFYTPKTGDIVVLDTSEDTIFFNGRQYSKPLIKRVIATGGQTVEVTDSEEGIQTVYVDGVALKEDYINVATLMRSSGQEKITVPEGYIFVMGDNRGESLDSRSFGCISESAIVGRALFRIFPLSEMGLLTNS